MFRLYDVVRLKKDDKVHGVKSSYLGAIVDVLSNSDETAYTVEFIDDKGETVESALFTEYRDKDLILVKSDSFSFVYDAEKEYYEVFDQNNQLFGLFDPNHKDDYLHDPIEETGAYKAVVDEADRLAWAIVDQMVRKWEQECPSLGIQIPTGHRFAFEKKRILKEKFGIEWRSVIEMNPRVNFD